MTVSSRSATPRHLWVVGILSLLWNTVGIASYTITMIGGLSTLDVTPEQIAYFDQAPAWATAFWALGVWGAFFGSVLLLLRSRWAVASFAIALVGLTGSTVFQRLVSNLPEEMRGLGLPAAIWIISVALLYYALRMRTANVLR